MAKFGKKEVINQTDKESSEDLLFKALLTGTEITREMAMSIPAVSKNVEKISNTFAMIPFRLFKETDNPETGKKETVPVDDDPRVKFLNDETGDTLDSFQFKKALCADYLMGQGGYAYIEKLGNNVTGLFYVEESKVSFTSGTDPIFKTYRISVNGKQYDDFDFIKLLRNTKNGYNGTGVQNEINKLLQSAFELLKYQLNISITGGTKKGFLKSQKKLSREAIEDLKKAWARLYSDGQENVIVLNDGIDFVPASATPMEMQLNETRTTLSKEIDDVFQLPPQDKDFYRFAVQPIVKAFETALNRELLLEKEKGTYYWAADTKELLRASIKERYDAYKIAKETGWLSLNEIRYLEDMEDIPGLDVIAMSLGSVLLNTKTGDWYVPNTGKTLKQGGEE